MKPIVIGWKEGFKEASLRAKDRLFPMLFFDNQPSEPGNFIFPLPKKSFIFSKQTLKALPTE